MHREFDPADQPFTRRSNLSLYFFTLLLVALLVADLWPPLSVWLQTLGLELPSWTTRELLGYRFALYAAILGGARTLFSSLESATEGKIGADLAVAIACIAAILIGEPLVAAEVVVIGLIGECLEAFTFDRTQRALRSLVELFPIRTWVLRDGQEVRVLTTQLAVGDHVVVKPGGKIPIDGAVLQGRSALDTSALTGESLPREVGPGDRVFAGSVNQFGALTIETQGVAKQTLAGQVIEMTASALKEKAPLERYADRLARRFLPAVLAISLVAFLVNLFFQLGPLAGETRPTLSAAARVALYPTLAVLVVACPCPLVLATPAAVIAALGRLAGTGVLIKGGAALERLASVKAFAFDKTGTLTSGQLSLGDVLPLGDHSRQELLRLAACAEQQSEHPLARVLLNAAQSENLPIDSVEDFQAHPGAGVSATLGKHKLFVGSKRLLLENAIPVTDEATPLVDRLDASGQTALLVAQDGIIVGAIGARDTLRPAAAGALSELRDLGFAPLILLTGDRTAAARVVADQLPLDDVRAELLPGDKAEAVSTNSFAFVGDGINDAPALARATVGIAIGNRTGMVAEAGDIVLMGDPLRPIPLLVKLARETVVVIRQNIIWFGFGINILGILITGFFWPLFAPSADWYENAPLVGVLYHQLGSLAVLLNSMRLLVFERTSSSRTLSTLQERYTAFDRWINTVHVEDLFHELLHHGVWIRNGVIALTVLLWIASGLTIVPVNEVGIVQRFGAPQADLQPGLHYRWPWPIETVTKIAPAAIRSVPIGFRLTSPELARFLQEGRQEQLKLRKSGLPGISDRDQTWASAHTEEINRLTDESVMITGDGNLIDVFATVRYSLDDPRTYLFGGQDAESIIRCVAESVLRELAAGESFFDLLTTNRLEFERRAYSRLQQRFRETAGGSLGIRFEGLTLHDLHPPQEVVNAYHSVAEAIQKRDRQINDAEAEAIRTRRRAEESALRIVREAEADVHQKISAATASRDAFLIWHRLRTELSAEEEAKFTKEIERHVQAGQDRAAAVAEVQRKREEFLAVRRALIELRMTLSTVASVFSGRDKVFLDVENIPGRRQLLLADPDLFKTPGLINRPSGPEREP